MSKPRIILKGSDRYSSWKSRWKKYLSGSTW